MPSSLSRANACRSVRRPSSGSWSILKSPVWTTMPAGVRMATARASGMEWLTATNSQSKGPMRSRCPSVDLEGVRADAVLLELRLDEGEGQLGADQRDVRLLAEEERDAADVVLVAVREDDALDVVEAVPDGREVRQDQVDSGLLLLGEEHAAVDDQQAAAVLEDRHVAADLAEAAERGDPQAALRGASAAGRVQDADDSKDSPHHARHVPAEARGAHDVRAVAVV